MFKNKYLKQLQDVQARIKNCTATITVLNPPEPDTVKIEMNVIDWLNSLISGIRPNVDPLCEYSFRGFRPGTTDYLEKLGNYLINVAKYEKEKEFYKKELMQLQNEERLLKEKLGID